MKKRKRKLKKRVRLIFVVFIIVIIGGIGISYYLNNGADSFNNKEEEVIYEFSEYMTSNKEVTLFVKDEEKYIKEGSVSSGVVLHLEEGNNYYKVLGLNKEYYVKPSKDLAVFEDEVIYDNRYKNYIVFNNNIVTEEITQFYDEDGSLVYSMDEGYSLPIIVKDTDKYGVDFGGRLLYIKAESGKVVDNNNTDRKNSSGVAVLNYHAFYDETNAQERQGCNTSICHSKAQFKTHLDYIKDNNILTLKMNEVEMYIDGKIQLPKSVLLTIDDGGRTKHGIDMLTEYKMYATIFLVTSWYEPSNYSVTDYIELHSHSHKLHNVGDCPTGQGGGIQCLDESVIQEDLKTTREKLNNTTYFCYPFYEYNEYSIKMLKQAGFTMAFIGESFSADNLVHPSDDKFRLRRFVIVDYTTMNDFHKYFSQIK